MFEGTKFIIVFMTLTAGGTVTLPGRLVGDALADAEDFRDAEADGGRYERHDEEATIVFTPMLPYFLMLSIS